MHAMPITREEALACFEAEGPDFTDLLARADRVRETTKGRRVRLCGIINAKSGRCSENCAFCAQSAAHDTRIEVYPLVTAEALLERGRYLASHGVREYSIVTSGKGIRPDRELDVILEALETLRDEGRVFRCASLGILPEEVFARLKAAGLTKYHHNLETARSFFREVCTSHDYDEDVATIRAARAAGLRVCSGGLFGLGESRAQRVELFETLIELGVDSVPVNFLHAIPGTRLEDRPPLPPRECLKILAVLRLMMPDADIYVCGGREKNLGDLASWIFTAGANGLMVGNYLTTRGRKIEDDLKLIADLGLSPLGPGDEDPTGNR